jgi:hypothetical protein
MAGWRPGKAWVRQHTVSRAKASCESPTRRRLRRATRRSPARPRSTSSASSSGSGAHRHPQHPQLFEVAAKLDYGRDTGAARLSPPIHRRRIRLLRRATSYKVLIAASRRNLLAITCVAKRSMRAKHSWAVSGRALPSYTTQRPAGPLACRLRRRLYLSLQAPSRLRPSPQSPLQHRTVGC